MSSPSPISTSPLKGRHPQMGTFKAHVGFGPNRMVTRQMLSQDAQDIENSGAGSLSSEGDSNDDVNIKSQDLKYKAMKRRFPKLEREKEDLLHRISMLKERVKNLERQLSRDESDRKTQLNVMKKTHEAAFAEKNRIISMLESILRDQESQLDRLSKKTGEPIPLVSAESSYSTSNCLAITRLTNQLNQIAEEKNNIHAHFVSQQAFIKELQKELKNLRRGESETKELQADLARHKKEFYNFSKVADLDKVTLSKLQQVHSETVACLQRYEKSESETAGENASEAVKRMKMYEDQITKLQDKLLVKEAEIGELDMEYRKEIQAIRDEETKQVAESRNRASDFKEQTSQSVQTEEKMFELQVNYENSLSKIETLQISLSKMTKGHQDLQDGHAKVVSELLSTHAQQQKSQEEEITTKLVVIKKLTDQLEAHICAKSDLETKHSQCVEDLEQQIKKKNVGMSNLRQEMCNKIVELEIQRDMDVESIEEQYKQKIEHMTVDYHKLAIPLRQMASIVSLLNQDYMAMKRYAQSLTQNLEVQIKQSQQQICKAIYDMNQHNHNLLTKYRKEMALRKQYHNELVELKGNIRVFCRVRPVLPEDAHHDGDECIVSVDLDDPDLLLIENGGRTRSFDVDRLFMPSNSQREVFDEVRALVTSVVDGYHVCMFAYGQTGSGKTYTMEGPEDNPGINQRALTQLFSETDEKQPDWRFDIQVSMLEIYNQKLKDLLTTDTSCNNLEVKMKEDGSLHVPGLTWVSVNDVCDVNRAFSLGRSNRATAATNMNEHSSRSHALLCVRVDGTNDTTGATCHGKLNLVDLAGSERVSKSGADGLRLKEAQSINKSLSSLGDVISALRNKQSFIPYRNSKLTYLLQDSLGGDSKTLMIVQIAPIARHVNETLCSMNFAQRVRAVELGQATVRRVETPELQAVRNRFNHRDASPKGIPSKGTSGAPGKRK